MQTTPSKFASWSLVASALILAAGIVASALLLRGGSKPVAAPPQPPKIWPMTSAEIAREGRVPDYWRTRMSPGARANALGLGDDEFIHTYKAYDEAALTALQIGWAQGRLGLSQAATVADYNRRCPPLHIPAKPGATNQVTRIPSP